MTRRVLVGVVAASFAALVAAVVVLVRDLARGFATFDAEELQQ